MLRKSRNPPARFPGDRPLDKADGKWWIAKVKPRQEKLLAFDLIEANIEYYLPMYTKVTLRRGSKKRRTSILPLFPGYICFAQDVPQNIYSTGRVVRLIQVKIQDRFIRELIQIERALLNGYALTPVNEKFTIEEEVEVAVGSLQGIRGTIASIRSDRKLLLTVEGLGKATLEIEMYMVKKVAGKKR